MENQNEQVLALLKKRYRGVVEAEVKSKAMVKGKTQLYQTNLEAIDASVNRSLKHVGENRSNINTHFESLQENVKAILRDKLKAVDQRRNQEEDRYKAETTRANDTLENKRELDTLKREKTRNDYDFKVKKANEDKQKTAKEADKAIEDAITAHNDYMAELIDDINARHEENDKVETDATNTFDETHQQIEATRQRRLNQLADDKSAYIESVRASIKALEKSYDEEKQPILEEIKTMETEFQREIDDIAAEYDRQIAKQENYKKESEKINDSDNVGFHEKKIKELKKQKQQSVEQKKNEREGTINPEKDKLNELTKSYEEKLYQTKETGAQKINDLLKQYDLIQDEQNIAIDEANTELNKALALHQKNRQNIEIDRHLQTVNIDHTLEEARAQNEHKSAMAAPAQERTENDAAYEQNVAYVELTQAKEFAESDHKKAMDTIKADYDYAQDSLSLTAKRLSVLNRFDISHIDIERRRRSNKLDFDHENMLVSHYYAQSENYSAYKSEPFYDRKQFVEQEINARLKQKTDMYNALLENAEKDHAKMVEKIEETFENEKAIYERPYESMREKHQRTIDELVARQTEARNKILEKIGSLNMSKHKKEIARLRKDLNIMKHEHEETLQKTKSDLKNKRQIHLDMIEKLKKAKDQSIEESQTLLYHYTDQINAAIETAKTHAQNELDAFLDTYYEIKHRSQLFKTFQRTRKQKTIDAANHYHKTRNQRLNDELSESKESMNKQLDAIDNEEAKRKQQHDALIQSINQTHEQTLETIEKRKASSLEYYKKLYEDEKSRLDNYEEKLRRKHSETMRNLKTDFNAKKEKGFADKETNEKNYHDEINRLDDELETEKRRKTQNRKRKYASMDEAIDTLLGWIHESPIENMASSHIENVEPVILGDKRVADLKQKASK